MHVLRPLLVLVAASGVLGACTTADLYHQIQGAQYAKCDKLQSAEDRRRCKAETSLDKEQYDKERAKARGGSSP